MKITDWRTQEIKDTPHKVDVRQLYDTADAQVMHITLQPGEKLNHILRRLMYSFLYLKELPISW